MRLRVVTTVLVLLGLALLFSYPWTVGVPPKQDASQRELADYATRMVVYVTVVSVCWLGAAISAALLARRIRQEYADQSLKNLADLLTSVPRGRTNDGDEVDRG